MNKIPVFSEIVSIKMKENQLIIVQKIIKGPDNLLDKLVTLTIEKDKFF